MSLRKNKLFLGAGLLVSVVSLTANSVLAGNADDTLTWATEREVDVVLPYYSNVRETAIMVRHVWDNLLYRDTKTSEYKPLLATSYKWVDNVTLEFELRKDVAFHNGSTFEADDVVATFNHVINPDNGVLTKRNVSWMKRAVKLGPYKVRVHLKRPFPAALEYLSGPNAILPAEIWATAKKDGKGKIDYGTIAPIGTGPYKITQVVPGESVRMEINKNYMDRSPKGKPSIGKLVFRTVHDAETRMAGLLTGSLDWIWGISKDKVNDLKAMGGVTIVNAPTMRINYIVMDRADRAKGSPLARKKVRLAVAHAIDREAIARELVGGSSQVIHSACFPSQFGCTQDVPKYEYNPKLAKKMLTEAGYPDGFEIDIYAYREREVTEAVIGYLKQIGIRANLKFNQPKALRGRVWEGNAPFHQSTWGSFSVNDVSAITSHFFTHGRDDYCRDDDVKKWLDVGDTSTDPKIRKDAYKRALHRIQEQLCWLPMFTYTKNYGYSKDLDFIPTADEFPRFFSAKWK